MGDQTKKKSIIASKGHKRYEFMVTHRAFRSNHSIQYGMDASIYALFYVQQFFVRTAEIPELSLQDMQKKYNRDDVTKSSVILDAEGNKSLEFRFVCY